MREWVYGRNPVFETLKARRRQPFRLWVAEGVQEKGRLAEIFHLCSARKVPVERVRRNQLDILSHSHQGVALEVSSYSYASLADILNRSKQLSEPPFILVLDTLQDPQNLGTLLRTAEITGVHGILLPLRHTATVTPAVVSSSSGASEHLLVAQANLAQAISHLKEAGLWVYGLENSPSAKPPSQLNLNGPIALVVGSEGEGLRPLVSSACDIRMRLPMRGQIESYNASVAGSIALFLAWQARGFSGSRLTIDDYPES
jgi:23S rRNA (guanosine2251-2'-O)-methyltransferase